MPNIRSTKVLLDLLKKKTVVELKDIRTSLGEVSSMTAFRYLKKIPYRRSYNHNGRYYCLHEPSRYDSLGFFYWKGMHFSIDGSLRSTVRRLVYESAAGFTHGELHELLKVRVHNTLLDLLRKKEIEREQLVRVYVYLHADLAVRNSQLERRREQIASQEAAEEITDHIVIQVLLTLILHPGSRAADVVRYLHGHSPPIGMQHVVAVFDRYDIESIGKKRGHSIC